MLAIPTVAQLADWSGRPLASFTGFANSALIQATLLMTVRAELEPSDVASLVSDDQTLLQQGILAMADYVYLRQPYQQVIASPLMNETIGSYSYGKAMGEVARNAQALEVTAENTGVLMFDLAVQMLSKRQRAGGVFGGSIRAFDTNNRSNSAWVRIDRDGDQLVLMGPADVDRFDSVMGGFSISSQNFPMDPGV